MPVVSSDGVFATNELSVSLSRTVDKYPVIALLNVNAGFTVNKAPVALFVGLQLERANTSGVVIVGIGTDVNHVSSIFSGHPGSVVSTWYSHGCFYYHHYL